MNRLNQRLADLRQSGRKALVTYIVSGDPATDVTVPAMHALVEAGADIIELGVPFSDPMAEGKVIQLGHERALANHVSLRSTMAAVKLFRATDQTTPVVLMGYANPVERMGYTLFAETAKAAGVDGLLTVDLPPEEATDLNAELEKVEIENIFLLAPTTTHARMQHVVELASGFLYYVSLKGVTGAGNLDLSSVEAKIAEIRSVTSLPVCVGFGIKDRQTAKAICANADGVVVGSVLVDQMGQMQGQSVAAITQALTDLVSPIRLGLDELV